MTKALIKCGGFTAAFQMGQTLFTDWDGNLHGSYNIGVDSTGTVLICKESGDAKDVSINIKGLMPGKEYTVSLKSSQEVIKADMNGIIKLFYEVLNNGTTITVSKNK